MTLDNFISFAATIGGGFLTGILIGYALKKVIKFAAVMVGLLFAGLAYLQYQQIANVNWDKLEQISKGAITDAMNTTITHMTSIEDFHHNIAAAQTMMNFAIPLTGSMSAGFTIGFMKG
jgi:uncharacterized membrane protein (Fun14 family)